MLTVLSFLLVIAVVVTVHEWGHYRVAVACGVKVLRFSIGFGKPLLRWVPKRQPLLGGQVQTTEFLLCAIPFGGYVKMLDESESEQVPVASEQKKWAFNNQALWKRAAIVAAGPLINLVFAAVLFAALNWVGNTVPQARIGSVLPHSAAALAGLQTHDLVLSVDDQAIADSLQLRMLIRQSTQGLAQRWQIERDAQMVTLTVTPQVMMEADSGFGQQKIGRLGAMLGEPGFTVEQRLGVWAGAKRGVEQAFEVCHMTLKMLGQIATGQASLKNLTGPVTIAEYSGKTAAMSVQAFISFIAVISASLGIFNLLPLPMLDGGHLMYYLWELATGKAVSAEWLARLQRLGLALLLTLTALALYNDLNRVLGLSGIFG